jgi:FKBP-type peptidyl-prolyl cis-trans isomerase SlyD
MMTLIDTNMVVLCHYTLRDGSATGDLIESTQGGEPLGFIHGIGMMIPAFEANLQGKTKGDSFAFPIKAADAYGDYNTEAIEMIPWQAFKLEPGMRAEDIFVPGEQVPLQNPDGESFMGTVVETNEEGVLFDLNPPLAGVDLYFSGEIVEVRPATREELSHGHVHGVGGHHH